jgi:hypothetical protein
LYLDGHSICVGSTPAAPVLKHSQRACSHGQICTVHKKQTRKPHGQQALERAD